MRKKDSGQKIRIVSFRIGDEELTLLKTAARRAKLSISELLRGACLELIEQNSRAGERAGDEPPVQEVWPRPGAGFGCYGSYHAE